MTATQRLRMIHGAGQVVSQKTSLDDLLDEVTALEAEAYELTERALPLARQMLVMATALGPTSGRIGERLVALLERHGRQHTPVGAA